MMLSPGDQVDQGVSGTGTAIIRVIEKSMDESLEEFGRKKLEDCIFIQS